MRPSPPLVVAFYGVILILIGRPNWVLLLGECLLVIAVVAWAVRFVRGFRGGKPSKGRISRKATTSAHEPLGEAIRSSGSASPVSEEAMNGAYTRLDAARSVVKASFEDESAEYIEDYLTALRSTWQALTATISRTGLLLVALMTIFYLLTTPGVIGSVSLGPFEIDDPLIIQKSIPIVVAYLYYELALMGTGGIIHATCSVSSWSNSTRRSTTTMSKSFCNRARSRS
jgi:hypothetical protein